MKTISVRLNEQELKKIELLKKTLEKEYCIEYSTSLLIKYCINRSFAQLTNPETWKDNKITG